MRVTKTEIKRLIKEELEAVLKEEEKDWLDRSMRWTYGEEMWDPPKDLATAAKQFNYWSGRPKDIHGPKLAKRAQSAIAKFKADPAAARANLEKAKVAGGQMLDKAKAGWEWLKQGGGMGVGKDLAAEEEKALAASEAETQQAIENIPTKMIPKPKRFARMSVKYLERRGYEWNPEIGSMIHPKKGDVRDVVKKYKKYKERKRKRKSVPTLTPPKKGQKAPAIYKNKEAVKSLVKSGGMAPDEAKLAKEWEAADTPAKQAAMKKKYGIK